MSFRPGTAVRLGSPRPTFAKLNAAPAPIFLEQAVSAALGLPVAVAVALKPLALDALCEGEQRAYADIAPVRQANWLLGRTALKQLLPRLGLLPDTSLLRFPHPCLSLTHSKEVAIAVASTAPLVGIGVDLEWERPMAPEALRFFLNPEEARQLRPGDGLRLWTVKEAVFKADLLNGSSKATLRDYIVTNPAGLNGSACLNITDVGSATGMRSWRYTSIDLQPGFITVAIAQRRRGRQS